MNALSISQDDAMALPLEERMAYLTAKVALHQCEKSFGEHSTQVHLARAFYASVHEGITRPDLILARIAERDSIKRMMRNPRAKKKPAPKPVWAQ